MAIIDSTDERASLLDPQPSIFINNKGFGGWRSASFIIGAEVAERFSFYGVLSNLITYLTGSLGQSTASAAESVNLWSGVASLLPLLGGFVADSFLGRYHTIVFASIIYIAGLGLLSIVAVLTSSNSAGNPSELHIVLFYIGLYLVAIGQGGHKPCVQAFGADQFDREDTNESKAKSSLFNWWYFSSNIGILLALSVLVYVQDNLGWAFGFGIPCIVSVAGLIVFLIGTKSYRYSTKTNSKHPFVRVGRVFSAAIKNRKIIPLETYFEVEVSSSLPPQISQQFKFLNKALYMPDGFTKNEKSLTVEEVEEAKSVLRLIPIWASCLSCAMVSAQVSTFFIKQGATMDRRIVSTFQVPSASMQSFVCFAILVSVVLYDRAFVPISRIITKIPSGITMLQRIGTGMVLCVITMVIAGLVETKRLKTAEEYGLVDKPSSIVPMSIWWLVPQYLLFGASDVFMMVGLQEFFYEQVPDEVRSIGISLYLSIFGMGKILSSLLVSGIDKASKGSWFDSNLNKAHLDYFYWLLAGLSLVGFILFFHFAKFYIYKINFVILRYTV